MSTDQLPEQNNNELSEDLCISNKLDDIKVILELSDNLKINSAQISTMVCCYMIEDNLHTTFTGCKTSQIGVLRMMERKMIRFFEEEG